MTNNELHEPDGATPEPARVRRPRPTPDPEANHVPSAGGMFSCMVACAIMLILYVIVFGLFVARF